MASVLIPERHPSGLVIGVTLVWSVVVVFAWSAWLLPLPARVFHNAVVELLVALAPFAVAFAVYVSLKQIGAWVLLVAVAVALWGPYGRFYSHLPEHVRVGITITWLSWTALNLLFRR